MSDNPSFILAALSRDKLSSFASPHGSGEIKSHLIEPLAAESSVSSSFVELSAAGATLPLLALYDLLVVSLMFHFGRNLFRDVAPWSPQLSGIITGCTFRTHDRSMR